MVRVGSLGTALLCVILTVATGATSSGQTQAVGNRYIVQIDTSVNASQLAQSTAQRVQGTLGHTYTSALQGFSIQLPSGLGASDLLSQPGVLRVEPDLRVRTAVQVVPTGIDRIDVDKHGTIRIDGIDDRVDVDIAIIDTGIDPSHPDLRVVGGRRFYTQNGQAYQDDKYQDDNGHGSHCAGIAAAIDNNIGVVGVAPGARLWAVKVLDSTGTGYLSDLIAGVDWVTARAGTIEVANMSLSAGGRSDIFRTAIQNSVGAGVVLVVAAGNDGKDVYGNDGVFGTMDDVIPAAYPEVATISAMADSDGKPGGRGGFTNYGLDDSFASFSNFSASSAGGNPVTSPGAGIDLILPGVSIYSCWMNGSYKSTSGTSMASPHATGLVALYIAEHGRATNASGVYAIRQALIGAGKDQASGMRLAHATTDKDGKPENVGWAGQGGSSDGSPTVDILYPADGSTVVGTVTIQVFAIDSQDATEDLKIQISVDGAAPVPATFNDGTGFHELDWDSTTAPDGEHQITASATDTDGNTSNTARIRVVTGNADNAPTAIIVSPQNGATLSKTVTVQVLGADDEDAHGSLNVSIRINDGDWQAAPYKWFTGYYELAWNTTSVPDGTCTIDARAVDASGNVTAAEPITVTVSNTPAPKTMHVASIDISTIPMWSGWQRIQARVVIVDAQGAAVMGALVVGTFSGDASRHVANVTDTTGAVVLEMMWLKQTPPRLMFCVDNVVHYALTYAPQDDKQTCDSND